jgi:hypothetical protein
MLLHSLELNVETRSLDLAPWIEQLYLSNDLRALLGSRAPLTLCLEREDSEHAFDLAPLERGVFAETNLCTGRCYYHDGRFYSASDTAYAHEMIYDLDSHVIRANLGGIYLRRDQAVVSNIIRPLLQSFILPFYGLKTLHGAVLSKAGRTLFLSGPGGTGKSTTTAQLIRSGYDLISYDGPFFTYLDSRAYALSSLDYLHVTEQTLGMFPELRPHVIGEKDNREKLAVRRAGLQHSDAWRRPLRVTAFIRLERGAFDTPRLVPRPRSSITQELMAETMIIFRRAPFQDRSRAFREYSEFIFDLVTDVVRRADVYELQFANHHLAELPALLDTLPSDAS